MNYEKDESTTQTSITNFVIQDNQNILLEEELSPREGFDNLNPDGI